MKDIFNDDKFNSYLDGGISDLEEGVGQLIHTIFKIPTVKSVEFSCEGHLGDYGEKGWTIPSTREGYIVTCNSQITFKYTDQIDQRYHKIITNLIEKTPFSELSKNNNNNNYDLFLLLLMGWSNLFLHNLPNVLRS